MSQPVKIVAHFSDESNLSFMADAPVQIVHFDDALWDEEDPERGEINTTVYGLAKVIQQVAVINHEVKYSPEMAEWVRQIHAKNYKAHLTDSQIPKLVINLKHGRVTDILSCGKAVDVIVLEDADTFTGSHPTAKFVEFPFGFAQRVLIEHHSVRSIPSYDHWVRNIHVKYQVEHIKAQQEDEKVSTP